MTAIWHVARDIANSGGGEVVRRVAADAALRGWNVTVLTDTPKSLVNVPNVSVKTVPFGPSLLRWQPESRAGWLLRHFLQILWFTLAGTCCVLALRPRNAVVVNHNCEVLVGEIVVLHNIFRADFVRRPTGGLRRAASFMNPVTVLRVTKEWFLTRSRNRLLVAVSDAASDELRSVFGDRDEAVRLVPNGVDLEHFAPPSMVESSEVFRAAAEPPRTVLFVGHEYRRKGLFDLVQALAELDESWRLTVVGGSSQDPRPLRELIERLGLDGRVDIVGEVGDTRPFLWAADVFCIPSYYETVPLVALEALAAGVPLVATPEVPAASLIDEPVNGAHTEHDPRSIAEAIRRAAGPTMTAERRQRISASVAHLSWESTSQGYLDLIAEVIERRG